MSKTRWTAEGLLSTTENGSGEWATPLSLFKAVDDEFWFVLDAAAQPHNAKCAAYITPEEDSLSVRWHAHSALSPDAHSAVWLNPPYGRGMGDWLAKAYRESQSGCIVVVLTFVRTDTAWWQTWATKAAEVRLIKGRVYFDQGGKTGPATAPSCLLVFSEEHRRPAFSTVTLPRGNER